MHDVPSTPEQRPVSSPCSSGGAESIGIVARQAASPQDRKGFPSKWPRSVDRTPSAPTTRSTASVSVFEPLPAFQCQFDGGGRLGQPSHIPPHKQPDSRPATDGIEKERLQIGPVDDIIGGAMATAQIGTEFDTADLAARPRARTTTLGGSLAALRRAAPKPNPMRTRLAFGESCRPARPR